MYVLANDNHNYAGIIVFFCSFIQIANLIFLNVIIALIMETYSRIYEEKKFKQGYDQRRKEDGEQE